MQNVNDDMSFDAIYDKITEFIVKRHGEKKFDEIVNSAKLNDEADIQCYVTLHLDYDPRIGEMDFADINPKIYCTTNSAYMLDCEKENGFMPFGKWAKAFLNGEAGAKSQEYAIRRKNFLSGKGDISERDLEDEMVIDAIKKVRNTPENESVTVDIPGGQMTMTGCGISKKDDVDEKYDKDFRMLKNKFRKTFDENLNKIMPFSKVLTADKETRRKVFPDGMLQLIFMCRLDLETAKKVPQFGNLNPLRARQQAAHLLNCFIEDDMSFLKNINNETRYEDAVEIIGGHYQNLHGVEEWAELLVDLNEPPVHCFYVLFVDYYPKEIANNGQNVRLREQFITDSDYSIEADGKEFQPVSVWIDEFLKGNAGPKSREYAIRLEYLRSGKGKISKEELKIRMDAENKNYNDDIITEMIKSLIKRQREKINCN